LVGICDKFVLKKKREMEIYIGGKKMKTKYVTVKVSYDTEDTWEITLQEVKEILQMMNNLSRNATIVSTEQGVNINDDGQDE
tara:strand:- start:253 stop:498 length:246 start_codon:yes stop_codon:yes gene_type:complete